jgi:SAM-dependent methyltransferase
MANAASAQQGPNPALIFETLNAFQRSAALKAGIELDLFTAIADGAKTAEAMASRCQAPERGIRILCDYLTIIGFLTKRGSQYELSAESAAFLNKKSPAYMGTMANFLNAPKAMAPFHELANVIRRGPAEGTRDDGSTADDNAFWVEFARSMQPLMAGAAKEIAGLLGASRGERWKVLDIAASHGLFGIAIAAENPNAEIVAVDFEPVLRAAKENAERAGLGKRFRTLPGSAFDVDFGSDYDVALVTNFFHHFDQPAIEKFARKICNALKPGGRMVTLEMVPNEDRVSPPVQAAFALQMLGGTKAGDAYTFAEFDRAFRAAGYSKSELHDLSMSPERVIISTK